MRKPTLVASGAIVGKLGRSVRWARDKSCPLASRPRSNPASPVLGPFLQLARLLDTTHHGGDHGF